MSTKDAIIVLISDYGRDEIQWGLSWEDVSSRVALETSKILRSDQMTQRIQFVIPFLPIPKVNCTTKKAELTLQVRQFIGRLVENVRYHSFLARHKTKVSGKMEYDVEMIAKELINMQALYGEYCVQNYRGLEKLFESRVLTQILKKIPTNYAASSSSSRGEEMQEVQISIKIPFQDSQVTVVGPNRYSKYQNKAEL